MGGAIISESGGGIIPLQGGGIIPELGAASSGISSLAKSPFEKWLNGVCGRDSS